MPVSMVRRTRCRDAASWVLVAAAMISSGCGGNAVTKTQPKMPRSVYESIFNQQMKTTMTAQRSHKVVTIQSLVKAKGFTMEDWSDAGSAYGIPSSIIGPKVVDKKTGKAVAEDSHR